MAARLGASFHRVGPGITMLVSWACDVIKPADACANLANKTPFSATSGAIRDAGLTRHEGVGHGRDVKGGEPVW